MVFLMEKLESISFTKLELLLLFGPTFPRCQQQHQNLLFSFFGFDSFIDSLLMGTGVCGASGICGAGGVAFTSV